MRAWPRLAEYFARFQLSTDLPCSLEVKCPSFQSSPLYIRPAAELERRLNKNKTSFLTVDFNSLDGDTTSNGAEDKSNGDKWDGGDGFDEGLSLDGCQLPKKSNADRQREEAEMKMKKKISLIHRAASAYKHWPDLCIENIAHAVQPIRRSNDGSQSTSADNGSVLEISLIVFGPDRDDEINDIDDRNEIDTKSSKLHVVRMVNGIPLLDSSEAFACGILRKVSSSVATWNSFGLDVLQISEKSLEFEVSDSSQVAPFLKPTAHSLFEGHYQDSDNDEFDKRCRGKRKKVCQVKCILPAALRLGYVLMIVQIRAKPSALPLPTLSKVSSAVPPEVKMYH